MNVVIALGTNMGDRQAYLDAGLEALEERVGAVTAQSSVWETAAYGVTDQADFLNMACAVETNLPPEELLNVLHEIEAEQDRVRTLRWGPRTLDLDIIYYGDEVYRSDRLTIPHADRCNRAFVLGPIAEFAPDLIDPETGKTVADMLGELENKSE